MKIEGPPRLNDFKDANQKNDGAIRLRRTTTIHFSRFISHCLYANVAKVGGLQIQGVKGEVVVSYFDPLTTQNLKFSGFPVG